MKNIIIVYNSMSTGGSTTSLLSLLNEIDYNQYEVDLLLRGPGIYESLIPSKVNILPYLIDPTLSSRLTLYKLFSLKSLFHFAKALYYNKIHKRFNVRSQIMSLDSLRFCRNIEKKYDVAISYIENLPMYYTLSKIKANKYITWIHLDYIGSKLNPNIDRKYLNKADNVVLVSEICKRNFDFSFPQLSKRSLVIENLLSQKYVVQRAMENIDYQLPYVTEKRIKFISVCRIFFFHKGLDRGIYALSKLKKEGCLHSDFIWYIVGDGKDYHKLDSLIKSENLTDIVCLCGLHYNPLPLLKQCDVFFLPSRYEGKPMAVTEAQMLGLLPVVTEYASANEQIKHNENGIILPNNDTSVYQFLKSIMADDTIIWDLKKNVPLTEYSNLHEYQKIKTLID